MQQAVGCELMPPFPLLSLHLQRTLQGSEVRSGRLDEATAGL